MLAFNSVRRSAFIVLLMTAIAAAAPNKITFVEGISEYRLDNGLKVLLFPDHSKPTVTVNLTIFVGSRHEGYGEAGMAHLLEHLLFKGTPGIPDIDKELTSRGARFNGSTWTDRTNYYETLEATDDNLEFAIRLEADRMVNSYVRQSDLDSEMTVVRNEFERGENSPWGVLSRRVQAAAFEWHNYGKSTIGNRSDIERVPIDALERFYKRHYRPENAMLVVAGQFDEQKALGYVQKYFGPLTNPTEPLSKTYTIEPAQDGERMVVLRRVGEVSLVTAAYHIPSGSHEDFAAVEIMEDILTSRPSGLLYQALVESGKAASVSGYAYSFHDPGLVMFTAEVRPDQSLDDVRDVLLEVIESQIQKGVTQEQVDRARQRFIKFREQAAANSARIAVQLSEWAAQGDWRLYFLHRDRIEKVTTDDVAAAAAKYLTRNNRTLGLFMPTTEPQRVEVPQPPDLASLLDGYSGREAIAAGEAFDPSPENIEARTSTGTLPAGMRIALLPKKTRGETVTVQLTLRFGDENSLRGLSPGMLAPLMTRATQKLSRQELSDALDKHQATLRGGGGDGVMSFTLNTKRPFLDGSLELMRQVVREPALPVEEFEIMKRQQLAGLEESRKEPTALAPIHVRRIISPYPKGDVRYVETIDESIARLEALKLDELRLVYDQFLGAAHGEVTVVGDFDPESTRAAIEKMLSGWTASKPYARIPARVFDGIDGSYTMIETPDKENTFYFSGQVFPMRDDHPDYPAMLMADEIFGGTFSSRLVTRIRHQDGLSYSVRSSFGASSLDERASFTMYAICNPANVGKVHQAMREEVQRMISEGVSQQELDEARNGWLKQRILSRASDNRLADILGDNLYLDRDMTWHAQLDEAVKRLTAEQVSAAFRKHIDPDKFVTAAAGDFAGAAARSE